MNKLIEELKFRELLKDIANEESLASIVENNGSFYIGIDPTADSIHVGHFLTLSLARILNSHGLKPVLVIGGFTGMIGDPSGRNSEREVIDRELVKNNVKSIAEQLLDLSNKMGIKDVEVFDNSQIYDSMSLIDLFQKYGKLFNINNMLNKESVQNRLENGISYTEFSYQLFQAIDFLYLYENKGVSLELGGSDQWGNITAGIELIRKVHGSEVKAAGITINLLTDENGNKIGKTQGKPMWLNQSKTSSYELFQYFINQTDATAKKLLLQTTDVTLEEFNELVSKQEANPRDRVIQNELAKRFISKVHSVEDYERSFNLSAKLFSESYNDIKEEDINDLKTLPSIENDSNLNLIDLIIEKGLLNSKREYREFLATGSIKINGVSVEGEDFKLTNEFLLDRVAFINVGKKNKYLIWK